VLLTVVSAHVLHDTVDGGWATLVARWQHWDADYYLVIAQHGYHSSLHNQPGIVAFFPGEPAVLKVVHLVIRNWTLSALVVSAAAGSVAVVALARLASYESGDGVLPERTVLYFVLSPFAVFLAAGYSESLFLALALPAWVAARRGNWRLAGLLAGLSATVRITGLFLGIALLVEHLVVRRRAGLPLLEAGSAWLLAPFVVTAGYFSYLAWLTGDWLAWVHAQATPPWTRHLTWPWHALSVTWGAARDVTQPAPYAWSFGQEIVAVAVGLILTIVLIRRRRWGETAYVGVQVLAFALSSFYLSVGRATLLWWPLWLLLARASLTRPWIHRVYLTVAPALMATYVIAFTAGGWVG
jgi:Mannosyltransferase (PIG-V)